MSIKTALLAATASILIMSAAHAGGPSTSPGGTSGGATDSPAGAPTMQDSPSVGGAPTADTKAQRASPNETEGSKDGTADNKASEGSDADRPGTKDAGTQGEKRKSAGVDREQIDKARTYFRQNKPSVKAVQRNDISVSIGLALPSTIVLYDAPPDVIVVSGGCPIKYFVWGDDVVLVDSCTREVIDII